MNQIETHETMIEMLGGGGRVVYCGLLVPFIMAQIYLIGLISLLTEIC
jgi:hypothetical protein